MRVLITGANSGIGKEAAIIYSSKNYEVLMVCRNRKRGETAKNEIIKKSGNKNIKLFICDMSSQKSIRELLKKIREKYESLDVLINNAANFDLTISKAIKTSEGFEQIWATNHLGPFLLSRLAVDLLKNGKKKELLIFAQKEF